MESPSRSLTLSSPPPPLHCLSTTMRTASPEFEFSNIGCGLQTPLHSADELFSDGFLLPLHFLPQHHNRSTEPDSGPTEPDHGRTKPGSCPTEPDSGQSEPDPGLTEPDSGAEPEPSALITSSSNSILSASKRWREMFKRSDKKTNTTTTTTNSGDKMDTNTGTSTTTVRSNNKSSSSSGNRNSSAELNINIWPFSRSRSAGNNSSRAKPVQVNRKVSSAPCSRSNSSGESKSRKSWPSSPGRAGIHLGRSSPVWQARKAGPTNRTAQGHAHGPGSGKGRVLKLNVPVCMGYRQSMSCRSDEGGAEVGPSIGSGGGGSGSNGNMFRLRGLFSKKSTTVLTV